MQLKKTEKEIIQVLVKYGDKEKTMAEVINRSRLLQNKGIAVVPYNESDYIFMKSDKYDWDSKAGVGYIAEMHSLLDMLIEKRWIVIIPGMCSVPLVLGKESSEWYKMDVIRVSDNEYIKLQYRGMYWLDSNGKQIYFQSEVIDGKWRISCILNQHFLVSQELRSLARNGFKTEEERRFEKQQCLTWVSIVIAIIIGILGVLF